MPIALHVVYFKGQEAFTAVGEAFDEFQLIDTVSIQGSEQTMVRIDSGPPLLLQRDVYFQQVLPSFFFYRRRRDFLLYAAIFRKRREKCPSFKSCS